MRDHSLLVGIHPLESISMQILGEIVSDKCVEVAPCSDTSTSNVTEKIDKI